MWDGKECPFCLENRMAGKINIGNGRYCSDKTGGGEYGLKCPKHFTTHFGRFLYNCYDDNPMDFWTCQFNQYICKEGFVTRKDLDEMLKYENDRPKNLIKRIEALERQVFMLLRKEKQK